MASQRMSKQAAWGVVDRYAEEHADVFGGAYFGADGEPVIVTMWTRDADSHGEALSAATGKEIGAREVRWTAAYLEELRQRVSDDHSALVAGGIRVCLVGDNVMDNCVEIGVTGLTPETERMLVERYGDAVCVVEEEIRFAD